MNIIYKGWGHLLLIQRERTGDEIIKNPKKFWNESRSRRAFVVFRIFMFIRSRRFSFANCFVYRAIISFDHNGEMGEND